MDGLGARRGMEGAAASAAFEGWGGQRSGGCVVVGEDNGRACCMQLRVYRREQRVRITCLRLHGRSAPQEAVL